MPTSSRVEVSGVVVLDEPVQGVPDLLRTNRQFCHRFLIRSSYSWCVIVWVCCAGQSRGAVRVSPKSLWASAEAAGHRPLDDLVAELDPDPAEHGRVDDVLHRDLAADLLASRPARRRCALLVGQRPGDPDGGDHPVLLRRGEGDVALDGVTRTSARGPRPPAWPARSSPAGPALQQLADQVLPADRAVDRSLGQRVAQLRSRTRPAGRTGTARPRSRPGRPPRSATHQLGPHGLPLEGGGEGPTAGPAHRRPPRPRCRRPASETLPSNSPWTRRCAAVLGRARVGQRPPQARPRTSSASTTANRSPAPASVGRRRHRRPAARRAARRAGARPAARDASAILAGGLPAELVAPPDRRGTGRPYGGRARRPRATRRRSGRPAWWPGHRSRCAAGSGPESARPRAGPRGLAVIRAASAWACSRSSARIWVPWVLASSRILAASVRASASCALYCLQRRLGLLLGLLGLLDPALDRRRPLGVGGLEPRHHELGDDRRSGRARRRSPAMISTGSGSSGFVRATG